MKCKIYLNKGDVNDATSYYIEIIEHALQKKGYSTERVFHIQDIKKNNELVLVIHAKAFFKVWLHNRKQKIVIWFQGIVPEEAKMLFSSPFQYIPRMILWRFLEKIALKYSYFSFFVSESMVCHYQKVYGYSSNRYIIMPCFNLSLSNESFMQPNKYDCPTFVYAGTLATWQCIEEVLLAYKKIENVIPCVKLAILTNEQRKAQKLIEKYNVINCQIAYVKKEELSKEMAKYKYGFLLRKDTIVNNVATPTKMNSYMAVGVIPIYSSVINDFENIFNQSKYVIKIHDLNNTQEIIEKIQKIENTNIQPNEIKNNFQAIFDTYYCPEKYIRLIIQKL